MVDSEGQKTSEIVLRAVEESDLPIFFEQQNEPEGIRMAAFPPRQRDAFMAHWAKVMADETKIVRTILFHGRVAGNVACWERDGQRNVGYWLGKEYWGQGVASAALSQFLTQVTTRPLHAHVAKHNLGSLRVLQKNGFTILGEGDFCREEGERGEEFILMLGGDDRQHQSSAQPTSHPRPATGTL